MQEAKGARLKANFTTHSLHSFEARRRTIKEKG
jgi:hypothetical protein